MQFSTFTDYETYKYPALQEVNKTTIKQRKFNTGNMFNVFIVN